MRRVNKQMKAKDIILEFVMVNCYNTIERWYIFMMYIWKTVCTPQFPIQLHKVEMYTDGGVSTDITNEYVTNEQWRDSVKNNMIHVHWSYDNIPYRYAFTCDNAIEFPPYTLEYLRSSKPKKKIAALCLNDEDNDSFELVKQYAGPMCDFYGRECDISNIVHKPVKNLSLIDTMGIFTEISGSILKFNI